MEPKRIRLPFKVKRPILGLGSHTKNTICFIKANFAYLSQVHADLSSPKDFSDFEKDAKYFLKKYPDVIAYDLHPEYQSTKYAHELNASRKAGSRKLQDSIAGKRYTLCAIQHHHAHIASCMLENGLRNQRVIGVAFDGLGLGSDGKLWGAEFLLCDYKNFKRTMHLKEIPLLGGQKAILEPARIALAWLYLIYKDKFLDLNIDFVRGIDKKKWPILKNMYLSKFNSPLSSSMGRLFDAVASLVFAKYKAGFEAQLAIQLEKVANGYGSPRHPACPAGRQLTLPVRQAGRSPAKAYDFKIAKDQEAYTLSPLPMFKQIVSDLKAKEPQAKIAYRFHYTVAQMVRKGCLILKKETGTKNVVLSGGVFQNTLLLNLANALLYKEGFKVFTHKELSCNDSGISLGQAVIADFRS